VRHRTKGQGKMNQKGEGAIPEPRWIKLHEDEVWLRVTMVVDITVILHVFKEAQS